MMVPLSNSINQKWDDLNRIERLITVNEKVQTLDVEFKDILSNPHSQKVQSYNQLLEIVRYNFLNELYDLIEIGGFLEITPKDMAEALEMVIKDIRENAPVTQPRYSPCAVDKINSGNRLDIRKTKIEKLRRAIEEYSKASRELRKDMSCLVV